jgi:hypothetical protein
VARDVFHGSLKHIFAPVGAVGGDG